MERALPNEFHKDASTVTRDQEQLSYLIHDMRSATTSVSLMVDLLELAAKAEDDSIQRARAVSAQKSCKQLALLCSEAAMLLSGTTDEGLAPEKFNLLELLVETVAVYSPIYDLAGKNLRMNATGKSPQFFGNRSQLFRAISNLLDNGLKHTSGGAVVDITCADSPEEFIVSIIDDGPGMEGVATHEPRNLESLPVVIKHMAGSSAIFAPGTGLRFVSETVRAHGGSSIVESNDNGGSTFSLVFQKRSPY
jgi:signal transduction histidine kinase